MLANLDSDTRTAWGATVARLRGAGVTLVEVPMTELGPLNAAVGFPLALYEAYDDMVAYLARWNTGVTIQQLAAGIRSPDVKGTYDGLVLPRKLPGPNNTLVDAAPAYRAAIGTQRPALARLYADTFASQRLDALMFPTVPRTAPAATPDSSSLENFVLLIQNTDPGSNAGVPGIQLPMALGATTGQPVGLELDGPAGSDRRLVGIGLALEQLLGRLPPPRR
jgi:mandelamide amidase